jgi:hypothetical protein
MKTLLTCSLIAGWALASSPAHAQGQDAETTPADSAITVGLKAGIGFPQVSSEFGTAPLLQLEAAYLAPIAGGRIGVVSALGYSAPSLEGTASDARLPGGTYTYEATQRQLNWDLGLLAKLKPLSNQWNANALVGLRMTFQSTLSDGEAGGEAFGEHDERASLTGLFLAAQGDYRLGPGAVVGELGYWASFQDLRTTGDLVLSEISILVGYRLAFAL